MSTPRDDPSSLSCQEVLERLYEFLDRELTPDADGCIREHLAACGHCFPRFAHERVFLLFLERRALIEKAPRSLRRRIFASLLREASAEDDDRGAAGAEHAADIAHEADTADGTKSRGSASA